MNKVYYDKMLGKGRLIPLIAGDRFVGLITFYICNKGEEKKYLRDDMWSVEEDNPEGNLCWVDQLFTSKDPINTKLSFIALKRFKEYIKQAFPNVQNLKWNRFKNNKVNVYRRRVR